MQPGVRFIDWDGTFFQGTKSDMEPGQVPIGYTWMTVNMLNLGGVLSCRPGYRCVASMPDGNLQGAAIFRPSAGLEQMIIVIDGLAYVSDFPFLNFRLIDGIELSASARQVYFCQTFQSARRLTPGTLTSAIEVIPTRSVMFIQDGGLTGPAWYDGSTAGHLTGLPYQTPAGGPMAWTGDRLWQAQGKKVFASDIANPFSFVEQIYLGGESAFLFASEVTAMVVTPSIEAPQLMVFTAINASILQANIRLRVAWPDTNLFQNEVAQVGCLASRSAASHAGRVNWFSASGMVFFDPATAGKITTRLPVRDNELLADKINVDDDVSRVAVGAFGQFLLISVPAEDIYNKHTWVLNSASLATLAEDSGPSWSGYWTGTLPVEWVYGSIAGQERIYHVSVDTDGRNRLWEAFIPDQLDNGCPITWAVFTRGYFGATAQASLQRPPAEDCRLNWVDLSLCGISEDLDVGVFYAGGTSGNFQQIADRQFTVARGSLDSSITIDASSILFALKPQSRSFTTEDANLKAVPTGSACGVESESQANLDTHFQLLITGQGPATLKWVKPFASTAVQSTAGAADACDAETGVRVVRYDGAAALGTDLEDTIAAVLAVPEQLFTSNQTVSMTYQGVTAVGVGYAESIISQRAADRVAERIASQSAAQQIVNALPPVLSIGLV